MYEKKYTHLNPKLSHFFQNNYKVSASESAPVFERSKGTFFMKFWKRKKKNEEKQNIKHSGWMYCNLRRTKSIFSSKKRTVLEIDMQMCIVLLQISKNLLQKEEKAPTKRMN